MNLFTKLFNKQKEIDDKILTLRTQEEDIILKLATSDRYGDISVRLNLSGVGHFELLSMGDGMAVGLTIEQAKKLNEFLTKYLEESK